jgi:hypothetical protein
VLFGSLWGVAEVVGGEFLWANDVPFPSVWLTAWGFFVMALARGLVPSPGSSAVVGLVATLYKLINASPFFCHLLGIAILGIAFDVAATLLLKKETKAVLRRALSGIAGVYAGSAMFAFLITYIIKYDPWIEGGMPRILRHIFVSGSLSAVCAAILVPLGIAWGLGAEKSTVSSRRPAWAAAGAAALIVILWAAGQLAKVNG